MPEQSLIETGLLKIFVEPTPSSNDPEDANEYYTALGLLIVAWGRLEGHFTACLLTLLNFPTGSLLGANVPPTFGGKVDMWRHAFRSFDELQPLKDNGLIFADKIQTAAYDRNDIVHALWETFTLGSSLAIDVVTIKKLKGPKNGLCITRRSIHLDTLRKLIGQINGLNMNLCWFSVFFTFFRVSQKPPPSDIQTI